MRKQRQEKPAPWRFLGVLKDTEQLCHPSAPPRTEKGLAVNSRPARLPATVEPLCLTLNGDTEQEVACESGDRWRSGLVGLGGGAGAFLVLHGM